MAELSIVVVFAVGDILAVQCTAQAEELDAEMGTPGSHTETG